MPLRQTALNQLHHAAGGRMVDFAGWEMPIQYHSIVQEHQIVRQSAGLFDVGHMGEITVRGPGSIQLLEYITCNQIGNLEAGQVRYNALMLANGGLVDDILVYRLDAEDFFLCVNASNTTAAFEHLLTHKQTLQCQCTVSNESNDWQQIAIQGPRAAHILQKSLDLDFGSLRYFRFQDLEWHGQPIRLSRTGYTGEDGFEIYTDAASAVRLWTTILAQNSAEEIRPIGLGARDSLRLEARLPLYGHELSRSMTPLESDIAFIVKEKPQIDWLGKSICMQQKQDGTPGRVCGFQMQGPGVPRHDMEIVDSSEQSVARVLSGVYSPILKKGIGTCYLPAGYLEESTGLKIQVRDKSIPIEIQQGPFVTIRAGNQA
ncbi:MAG: glycine cleavage system aminomethyltransferase GcvT [Leptospiraceae bacterium]|nr:glycine cleavage system aminomethyltransferase GcvT [Leptospiraceae bacterium]